jgi:biotin synthase-related radical SAM superfamily protein
MAQPLLLHAMHEAVGVSAGTAAVIGLRRIRQTDPPTTAYLMVGARCASDCAFCTQARSSTSRTRFLSRVAWPLYPAQDALAAIARSFAEQKILRCCLQVTVSPGYVQRTLNLVQQVRDLSPMPICVSIAVQSLVEIETLLASGVDRVTVALDAACERVYCQAKGPDWQDRLDLLRYAAESFPGHIGTHLIAGLGETEQEMALILQELVDRDITAGLFAFTPVPGAAWDDRPAPDMASYRRIQAARYLLATEECRAQDWAFSTVGRIVSYGLGEDRLHSLLSDGVAFQTAGCGGCNRPYYNEHPGKELYNYPRPLSAEESRLALALAMAELVFV